MANGIWLYYTKKGNLAKIQHGQVIRQGGGFKLIFAFEDESLILDRVLTVAFKKPGGETTPFYPVAEKITKDNIKNYREKFNKIKATEMTYGLQDGVDYYALDFNVPNVGITEKYGVLTVITKVTETVGNIDFIDKDGDNILDEDEIKEKDDIVYFQGSVQLYIEPTYGKPAESSNISMNQYEALLNHINTEIAKKVSVENGVANNITLNGLIDAQNENTHLIVNTPRKGIEGDHDAATRQYVDNSFASDPTIVNPTLKGDVNARTIYVDDNGDEWNTYIRVNDIPSIEIEGIDMSSLVANKGYVDSEITKIDNAKVDYENGSAKNLTLNGDIAANIPGTFIKVNEPEQDNHAVNKRYVDRVREEVDENKESIESNRASIESLYENKLNKQDDIAKNLKLIGTTNAQEGELLVKPIDKNDSPDNAATNKGYVDARIDDLKLNKYAYSEDAHKDQLIRNGQNINPITSASNVRINTTEGTSDVQTTVDKIKSDMAYQNYFKGIKDDIKKFNDYDNYKPGDYAIVAKDNDDDLLYIWDEGKDDWVKKGAYSFAIKSINGQLPDSMTGDVSIDSSKVPHILNDDGTVAYSVKTKLDELENVLNGLNSTLNGSFSVVNSTDFDLRNSDLIPGIYVMPISEEERTITYKSNGSISLKERQSAVINVESNVSNYNSFEVFLSTGTLLKGKAYHSTDDGYANKIIENDKLYSTNKEVALKEDLDNLEDKTSKDLEDAKTEINNTINTFKDETNDELENIKNDIGSLDLSQLRFKGDWTSGSSYKTNDVVSIDGKHLYVCIQDVESSATRPDEDANNWRVFVKGFSGNYDDLSGTPVVDTEMSDTSENPVQNKVIKSYIDNNTPDVSTQIGTHNDDEEAHPEIRALIEEVRSLLPSVVKLG